MSRARTEVEAFVNEWIRSHHPERGGLVAVFDDQRSLDVSIVMQGKAQGRLVIQGMQTATELSPEDQKRILAWLECPTGAADSK
jgi:hypothetical protein